MRLARHTAHRHPRVCHTPVPTSVPERQRTYWRVCRRVKGANYQPFYLCLNLCTTSSALDYADTATGVCNTGSNRAMTLKSFSSSCGLKQCMSRRRAVGQGGAGGSGRAIGGLTCPP